MPARLGSTGGVCVCEGRKGFREGGWGSCDPTAPRPALQAGETQAHVGAPLPIGGSDPLVVYPGVTQPCGRLLLFDLSTRYRARGSDTISERSLLFLGGSDAQHHAHWGATWIFASTVATSHLCGDACQRRQRRGRIVQRGPQSNRLGSLQGQHVTDLCDPSRGTHLDWRLCLRGLQQPHLSHLPGGTR